MDAAAHRGKFIHAEITREGFDVATRKKELAALAVHFVVSPVKHDFAGSSAIFSKVGASFSKDFAFFHQTADDFAKPGSPQPLGPHGAGGQVGRFSR